MTLREIGGRWGDNVGPTSAAEGPGAPTLRGLGTSKHTPAEGLTRRWAVGPANYYKIAPLSKGLFLSHTHGSPSAPWVSRATTFCCPRGGSAAPTRPDEYRKLLRWNGCGCWDVLRWLSKRRGPRTGHSSKSPLRGAARLGRLRAPPLACGDRPPVRADAPHRPRRAPHVHAPLLSEATAWEGTGKRVEEKVHQYMRRLAHDDPPRV